ncbi:MAG TPA: hypothetical protein VF215_12590, partial [Thermoanaerobaculia bacterium]
MPVTRTSTTVEWVCLALLLAWLAWLPLPFGSIVPRAWIPLIAVPLFVCTIAAIVRLIATRDRTNTSQLTRTWIIWATGGFLLLALAAFQLVPLPAPLLARLSPESEAIWGAASRVARLAGTATPAAHPISIDP